MTKQFSFLVTCHLNREGFLVSMISNKPCTNFWFVELENFCTIYPALMDRRYSTFNSTVHGPCLQVKILIPTVRLKKCGGTIPIHILNETCLRAFINYVTPLVIRLWWKNGANNKSLPKNNSSISIICFSLYQFNLFQADMSGSQRS